MSKKISSMGLIKSERGNFAILFAVTLMVLISVMAFGLDIGFFARTKSKYQACADAAALSGAEKLCYGRAEERKNRQKRLSLTAIFWCLKIASQSSSVSMIPMMNITIFKSFRILCRRMMGISQ